MNGTKGKRSRCLWLDEEKRRIVAEAGLSLAHRWRRLPDAMG